jgi:hydroxypyruvate isomerase
MPNVAANLSFMFTELDFLDRFEAAARAGFRGVEFHFPYDLDGADLAARMRELSLVTVLHNLPPGDWAAGERGIACHPDRVDEFREGVRLGAQYARLLGCRQLNCLAGIRPEGAGDAEVEAVLVDNLRYAAAHLAESAITLLIEPINTRDVPGFYLSTSAHARALIEAVGSPNLKIQYDIYHMQIMEGDLAPTIRANLDVIGHVQVADNPGRHEPGTGEINYPFLFAFLDDLGYEGWVAGEYVPSRRTEDTLEWAAPYLRAGA